MFKKHPSPYKHVAEYLISKETVKNSPITILELLDDPSVTLSQEKRTLNQLDGELAEETKKYKEKCLKLKKEWEALAKSEIKLRNGFVNFNKFVKDNLDKKIRAEDNLSREEKRRVDYEEQVKSLKEKLEQLKHDKENLDSEIRSNQIYMNFLYDVVDLDPSSFTNIDDVISGYETLSRTRHILGERQGATLSQLENARHTMNQMITEYSLKILGLQTQMATINQKFDGAQNKSRMWENAVDKIKINAGKQMHQAWLVKESIWNLVKLMQKRVGEHGTTGDNKLQKSDVEGQLIYIKKVLEQLRHVRVHFDTWGTVQSRRRETIKKYSIKNKSMSENIFRKMLKMKRSGKLH